MSAQRYYVLEGHRVVAVDPATWTEWFATTDNRVAFTVLGDVEISTVFLGLDCSLGRRVPRLFETMIFGGKFDETQERYSTWQDAEVGHAKWVDYVKADQSRSFEESVNEHETT